MRARMQTRVYAHLVFVGGHLTYTMCLHPFTRGFFDKYKIDFSVSGNSIQVFMITRDIRYNDEIVVQIVAKQIPPGKSKSFSFPSICVFSSRNAIK